MKELNEMELRDVEGGHIFDSAWFACRICEFIAGFEDGWAESKR